ncbi:MAG: serine hydrolase [Prevotella sp.]|nr:serine hydrolase [Prevotella sp.]
MKKALLSILTTIVATATAQVNDLPRTSPEAVGLKSTQVSAFFDSLLAFPKTEIHSVMVMRHGKVVGEMYPAPFRAEYKHTQFSCSKTFVAAAVGIAIGEKKLRLTDRLVSFFPEYLPKIVGWQLSSITVEDLLTMRSGFVVDTKMRNKSHQWIRDYLAHPMNAAPGKLFQYDSIDTYLLSAIVQRVTGMTVLDYLRQKVFKHLNITDVKWEISPEGIVTGGWGLYIQSESLAKFGQLLLQRGQWNGRQLIPATWVEAMMKKQVDRKENNGYGYQMWMCNYPTAVRADGAYGQYIVVIPRHDMVVVITQCMQNDGGRERAYIWNTLLRGMKDEPLPPSDVYLLLQQRRDTLPLLNGDMSSPLINDYQEATIRLQKNPLGWTSLSFEADDILEVTDTAGVTGRLLMGYQTWATSPVYLYPLNARYAVQGQFSAIRPPFLYAACYAWQNDELQVKLHSVDWMGSVLLRFRFDGDTVFITAKENYQARPVSFIGTRAATE